MNNVHLWQYIVIAGPAAILGGLAVWFLCREYERGLEDALLGQLEPMPAPEHIISMQHLRAGKSHSAFLAFRAACECGARMLYRGPGYVVMPDAMYEELAGSRERQDRQKRVTDYMLGMDPGRPEGSVDVWRQP